MINTEVTLYWIEDPAHLLQFFTQVTTVHSPVTIFPLIYVNRSGFSLIARHIMGTIAAFLILFVRYAPQSPHTFVEKALILAAYTWTISFFPEEILNFSRHTGFLIPAWLVLHEQHAYLEINISNFFKFSLADIPLLVFNLLQCNIIYHTVNVGLAQLITLSWESELSSYIRFQS